MGVTAGASGSIGGGVGSCPPQLQEDHKDLTLKAVIPGNFYRFGISEITHETEVGQVAWWQ